MAQCFQSIEQRPVEAEISKFQNASLSFLRRTQFWRIKDYMAMEYSATQLRSRPMSLWFAQAQMWAMKSSNASQCGGLAAGRG